MKKLKCIRVMLTEKIEAGKIPIGLSVVSGAAVVALTTVLGTSNPAVAAATAVTFTGAISSLPAGSGTITVAAEIPSNVDAHGVPGRLTDIPVATVPVGAGAFSVAVPDSATLASAESVGNGNVNFALLVKSGDETAMQYVPAALTAQAAIGNDAATLQATRHVVTVPAFPAFTVVGPSPDASASPDASPSADASATPDGPPSCLWTADGGPVEDATRTGEVHVDKDSGSTDTYQYKVQADSTISVGLQGTSGSFTTSGSVKITNSFSGSGSFPNGPGTLIYANGDFYYQKYDGNSPTLCGGTAQVRATSAVGDAFQGTRQPAANPYGSCLNDPNGFARADKGGGTFNSDRGTALEYSGIANIWGYQFGGSTGFSNDIYQDYTNNSSVEQYYCGTSQMPDSPVIYNADH